uniref:Uncharacterized protein n=1 Tax=Rhizophora mucronata TaxID=61149 RepID=A0A2P2PJG5_RHIMU
MMHEEACDEIFDHSTSILNIKGAMDFIGLI